MNGMKLEVKADGGEWLEFPVLGVPRIDLSLPPDLVTAIRVFDQSARRAAITADEFARAVNALARAVNALAHPPSYAHIHRALARGAAHKRKQEERRVEREALRAVSRAMDDTEETFEWALTRLFDLWGS